MARKKPKQGLLGRKMDELLAGHALTAVGRAIRVPYGTLDGWKKLDELPDTALARARWQAFEAECARLREEDDVSFNPQLIKSPHHQHDEVRLLEKQIALLTEIESNAKEARDAAVLRLRELKASKKTTRNTG